MLQFHCITYTLVAFLLRSALPGVQVESFSVQPKRPTSQRGLFTGISPPTRHSAAMINAVTTLRMGSDNNLLWTHNFGPASARDTVLYTAERPGNPTGKTDVIPDEKVQEWIAFMKEKGIGRVIILLDDNEFTNYCGDLGLLAMYEAGGLQYNVQSMNAPGASENIMAILQASEKGQEKVVTHCTGGVGRSGRVAAGWLVERYNLTPALATEEALAQGAASGINRKGDASALAAWLGK
jgi:hypothetical protein